jgi:hypothetical protein
MSKNERIAALEAQLRAQQDEIAMLRQRIEALEARPYIEFAPDPNPPYPDPGPYVSVSIASADLPLEKITEKVTQALGDLPTICDSTMQPAEDRECAIRFAREVMDQEARP